MERLLCDVIVSAGLRMRLRVDAASVSTDAASGQDPAQDHGKIRTRCPATRSRCPAFID